MNIYDKILMVIIIMSMIYNMYILFGEIDINEIKEEVKKVGLTKYFFNKLEDFIIFCSVIGVIFAFLAMGILLDGLRYERRFDILFSLTIIIIEGILIFLTMIIIGDIKIKHKKLIKKSLRKFWDKMNEKNTINNNSNYIRSN